MAYVERITSFRFFSGGDYATIAEQPGDPRYRPRIQTSPDNPPTQTAAWTEGRFDFMVNAIINARDLNLPATVRRFGADGKDLFYITYERTLAQRCRWWAPRSCPEFDIYTIKTVTPLIYTPLGNVDLISWDLDKYAASMYITFKELDNSGTQTIEDTGIIEYAGNFGTEGGVLEKIGLKFGVSAKKTYESKRITVLSLESDDLAGQNIEFGHRVITGEIDLGIGVTPDRYYQTREYSTGVVGFSLEPARVE